MSALRLKRLRDGAYVRVFLICLGALCGVAGYAPHWQGKDKAGADTSATRPSSPMNLSATPVHRKTIRLWWESAEGNVTGYRIERKLHTEPDGQKHWDTVGTTSANQTTLDDTLPGDDPRQWVKLWDYRVWAINAFGASAHAAIASQSGVSLQDVTYEGWTTDDDTGQRVSSFQSIKKDDGTGAYDPPQWHDVDLDGKITAPDVAFSNGTLKGPDEHTFPLSFLRSRPGHESFISAEPAMMFSGAAEENWMLKGDGSGYSFKPTAVQAIGGLLRSSLEAALPETIDSKKLEITWQLSTDGGANFFNVGTSINHIYVTGGKAGDAYETVLDLGCTGAIGKRPHNPGEVAAPKEDDDGDGIMDPGEDDNLNGVLDPATDPVARDRAVIDGVWSSFKGNSTRRVDGVEMKYGHSDQRDGVAFKAFAMLSRTDGCGQCSAWAGLLASTLTAQGLAPRLTTIRTAGGGGGFSVRHMPAQGSSGADYLTCSFDWHEVISIDVYTDAIFDPSYGGLTEKTDKTDARSVELKYEDENVTDVAKGGVLQADDKGVQQLEFQK